MGLLNTFNDWMNARYEKRVAKMEEKGLCPECSGRGFNAYGHEYFYGSHVMDCPGCNGTGSYNEWHERNK